MRKTALSLVFLSVFIPIFITLAGNGEAAPWALDTLFNGVGFNTHHNAAGGNGSDFAYSVAIDAFGNIVAAGYSVNASGNNDMAIWYFRPDGTLDTSFSADGIVTHNGAAGGGSLDFAYSVAIDAFGNIVAAGLSRNASGNDDMAIWRYKPDGTLDTSFSADGIVTHHSAAGGNSHDYANSIDIDAFGNIVAAGGSRSALANDDMAIWRYKPDGTLDTSFSADGIVTHHGAAGGGTSDDYANSIAIDAFGNIVAAGKSRNTSFNDDMSIWRYKPNGTLDTSFNGVGFVTHNGAAGGNAFDSAYSVAIDASGNIVAAGYSINASSNSDMAIWRYKPNGTLDTSFSADGIVTHHGAAGGNGYDYAYSVAIDAVGNIVAAGESANASSNSDMAIWRYNTNGTLDTLFNTVGFTIHNAAAGGISNSDDARSIAIDSSGRIVAAGMSKNSSNNNDMAIWRYAEAVDTTAPTVLSVTPTNSSVDVATNTLVTATFSEAMDAGTINTTTFTLGGPAGTVTYSALNNTATFTPSSALSAGTLYTASITNGVRDVSGNVMASNYNWSFTTAAAPDTTAPAVSSVSPLNSSVDVASTALITVTFDETMASGTINTTTFTLSGGATGAVTYNALTNTATFTPSSALSAGTLYTATVTNAVTDTASNHPAADYTWTFTTAAAAGGGGAAAGGGGGGCFIATAAYGSALAPEVETLRAFRDDVLMQSAMGRAFVSMYYKLSPPVADVIAEHESLRTATRISLMPAIFSVRHPETAGLGLIGIAAALIAIRRARKK